MAGKTYPGSPGPTDSNTPGDRLWKRFWARSNLTTTKGYNRAEQVTGVDYSDATPDVTTHYNRRVFR